LEINMAIDVLMASQTRLVTVDGDGWLRPAQGEPIDATADELFTVVVLWDLADGTCWTGWLATMARRTACFGPADLEDPIFQSWLRALPGWNFEQLRHATTNQGFHLVWRRA
jgi:hypothetical protein